METHRVMDDNLAKAINSTKASDWKYIAEGTANLMVAYNPPSSEKCDLHLRNKCLRLQKQKIKPSQTLHQDREPGAQRNTQFKDETTPTITNISPLEDEVSFLDFHQQIICHLINPTNLLQFELIKLELEWLHELNTFIEPTRPAIKQTQECIDPDATHALLMDNLTSSETDIPNVEIVAVEIKPKWSFLPQTPSILDAATCEIKSQFCRSCVFRAVRSTPLKKSNQMDTATNLPIPSDDVGEANDYYISSNRFCSLQLFDSKNPLNRRLALDHLYKEWKWQQTQNPCSQKPNQTHNNFKIFRDGVLINPLSVEFDSQTINVLAKALEESQVLKRLDFLQRRLDPIDIEGIHKIMQDNTNFKNDILMNKINLTEFEEILPLLSEEIGLKDFKKLFNSLALRKKLIMYGLSMSFKDCSIFVRLPIIKELINSTKPTIKVHNITEQIDNISVNVIDLDMKPLSRIPKYFQKDRQVFDKFKRTYLLAGLSHPTQSKSLTPVTCQEICNHQTL